MNYDLGHLIQDSKQDVLGPIQDDEALLLFAFIRCCRIKTVLEIGGLEGYSAINFLKAVSYSDASVVFSVELQEMIKRTDNHIVIRKYAHDVTGTDVHNKLLGLVFFDCHDEADEMIIYNNLVTAGCIDDTTVLVLHDTNCHPKPNCVTKYEVGDGWVHQTSERKLVNWFKSLGYDCVCVHTKVTDHDASFPYRHGLTICRKFKKLEVQ